MFNATRKTAEISTTIPSKASSETIFVPPKERKKKNSELK